METSTEIERIFAKESRTKKNIGKNIFKRVATRVGGAKGSYITPFSLLKTQKEKRAYMGEVKLIEYNLNDLPEDHDLVERFGRGLPSLAQLEKLPQAQLAQIIEPLLQYEDSRASKVLKCSEDKFKSLRAKAGFVRAPAGLLNVSAILNEPAKPVELVEPTIDFTVSIVGSFKAAEVIADLKEHIKLLEKLDKNQKVSARIFLTPEKRDIL